MNNTDNSTAQDETLTRFLSLESLRAAHHDLLKHRRAQRDRSELPNGATSRDFTKRHRVEGDSPEFLAEVSNFIKKGQATGVLLDDNDDRSAAQSLLDYWSNDLYRAGREPPNATLADFDPSLAPELDDALCPYLGLKAFQEKDRQFFFGRQKLIEALVDKLKQNRKNRLLAVLGPSGSGKSSLVLAGLLPRLRAGMLSGSQDWRYLEPMVPASNPLENLARLIQPPEMNDPQWIQMQVAGFRQHSGHLSTLICEWGETVLIIVDQFEELFTLCRDEATRQAFVGNLLDVIKMPDAMHTVILTMRTDFETYVATLPRLHSLFPEAQVRVTPLSASELREAIEKPADSVGLRFEKDLVDDLLQDILGEPAGLPLLQFSLLKLWENRQRNRVTWETYNRLGGGRLALARSADAFYKGLIPEDQVTAKRILLRLVRPGEGLEVTRNRIRREALYQSGEASERIDRVLDGLIEAHLVNQTGETPADTQVEVVHEALVRNWPKLVEWLDEERVHIRQRLRLTDAAEQWDTRGREPGALLRGALLEEARQCEDLNDLEREFVQAGQKAQEQEAARQRRIAHFRWAALGTIVLLIMVVLGLGWLSARRDVQRQQTIVQQKEEFAQEETRLKNEAIEAQEKAEDLLTMIKWLNGVNERDQNNSPLKASHYFIQTAAELKDNPIFSKNAQLAGDLLVRGAHLTSILEHKSSVTGAVFSADATKVLTWSKDNIVRVWNSTTGEPITDPMKYESEIWAAIFSGDTTQVLTWSRDGTTQVWSSMTGEPLTNPITHGSEVLGSVFSADATQVLTWSRDGTARVWDSKSDTPLTPPLKHMAPIIGAVFSADATKVLTWSRDNTARVWDSKSGTPLTPPLKHMAPIIGAVFSADATKVLTWCQDNTARFWDSESGTSLTPPLKQEVLVTGAVFSTDAHWVLTWSEDAAWVWDSATGKSLTDPMKHKRTLNGAVFSPDTSKVLTWSLDGTARIWNSATGTALTPPLTHEGPINGAVFSADGRRVLTWSFDDTARVWDSVTGQALTPPLTHERSVSGAVFSADGRQVLTWSLDGCVRIWDLGIGTYLISPLSHEGPVNGAVFSADGRRVLTWSLDGTARIWDSMTGIALSPPLTHKSSVNGAVFSADGRRVLTWSLDGTARIWDSMTGIALSPPLTHKSSVKRAVFSADGRQVLSWSEDTVRVWDSMTGKPLANLMMDENEVWGASFSADTRRVLTWSENALQVWDSESGTPLTPPLQHAAPVTGAIFNTDTAKVLTWSENAVRVWDSSTGTPLTPSLEHNDAVTGAIFSADATKVLTWSKDAVWVWDSTTGEALIDPMMHESEIWGAIFSDDESRVLTWSEDNTARVWDSMTGAALTPPLQHAALVTSAVFSKHATKVLTWSEDGSARVWDSKTGNPLTPPLKHNNSVIGAIFSNDESRVLTWSEDGSARVWDSMTGKALTLPLKHNDSVTGAVFSNDESRVLTWSRDGTARVWELLANYDFPQKDMTLQLEVQTGTRLNETGEIETIPREEWQEKKLQYEKIAEEHLKVGQYPRANMFLNHLINLSESCERPGEWMQEMNPDVVSETASWYARICLNRGNFYLDQKDYDKAMRNFETALQIQTAYLSSTDLEIDAGRVEAQKLVEQGKNFARKGDVDEAVAIFQIALKLDPGLELDPQLEVNKLANAGVIDVFDVAELPSTHPGVFLDKGGKAVKATTTQGFLSFGPLVTGYPSRALDVYFSVFIDNNTADNQHILTLDIYDSFQNKILAKKIVTRRDFLVANAFNLLKLTFIPPEQSKLEFRIYYNGWAYVVADRIAVVDPEKIQLTTHDAIAALSPISDGTGASGDAGDVSENVILSESLKDGRSVGEIRNGSLTRQGLQLRGGKGFVSYHIPTTTPRGFIEFSARGFVQDELHGGSEYKGMLLTMWDEEAGYSYANAPFIFELRKYGYIEGRPYASNTLRLKIKSNGEWTEGRYNPLSWDPNTSYQFRIEWGEGEIRVFRNRQLVVTEKYHAEFAPSDHRIQIGANPLRGWKTAHDLLISDVVIGKLHEKPQETISMSMFKKEGDQLIVRETGETARLLIVENFGFSHFPNEEMLKFIDAVANSGANGVRVIGFYPYGKGREEEPYPRIGDRFDLSRLNDVYVNYLRHWMDYAKERGVVVIYELFDSTGVKLPLIAQYHPFGQFTGGDLQRFSDLSNSTLIAYQKNYLTQMVNILKQYPNVIFGIMNEFAGDKNWHYEMSRHVKSLAPNHLIFGSREGSTAMDDPNVDIWVIHTGSYDRQVCFPNIGYDVAEWRPRMGNKILAYSTAGFGLAGMKCENPVAMRRLAQEVQNHDLQIFQFYDHSAYVGNDDAGNEYPTGTWYSQAHVYETGQTSRANVETYQAIAQVFVPTPPPLAVSEPVELPFVQVFDVINLPSNHPDVFRDKGGKAIRSTSTKGFLSFGPYVSGYPSKFLDVYYGLYIDDNTVDNNRIVTLDVYDSFQNRVLARKTITRKQFPKAGEFNLFKLRFRGLEGSRLEFRIFYEGYAYIAADRIAVVDPEKIQLTTHDDILALSTTSQNP